MGMQYTLTREELLDHAEQAFYRPEIIEGIKGATDAQLTLMADQVMDEIVDGRDEIYAIDHAVAHVLFADKYEAEGDYFFLIATEQLG